MVTEREAFGARLSRLMLAAYGWQFGMPDAIFLPVVGPLNPLNLRAAGALLIGFVTVLVLTRLILSLTQRGVLPQTQRGFHHTHTGVIPRFGGVAIAVALLVSALIAIVPDSIPDFQIHQWLTVVAGTLAVFTVGLWDDIRPLGAKVKLAAQVLICSVCYFGGLAIEKAQIPFTGQVIELGLWGWPLTVLWLIGMANLINLVDGIDGLAGGISLMLMALLTYVAYEASWIYIVTAGVAGALVGFLKYNFPPAKIYMGDGGAYMLGFFAGAAAIISSHKGTVIAALVAPLFVLALPIIDTTLAIVRRGLRGLPIFRADTRHIHHRLLQMGLPREKVVLGLYLFTLFFLVLAFAAFMLRGHGLPVLLGVALLTVLVAAYQLDFAREWFAISKLFQGTAGARREIQYALALARWLSLEGNRCAGIEELWDDLVLVCRKLNFGAVRVCLDGRVMSWENPHLGNNNGGHAIRFPVGSEQLGTIEFAAPVCVDQQRNGNNGRNGSNLRNNCLLPQRCAGSCPCVADPDVFSYAAEVVAEGWHKAITNWKSRNQAQVAVPAKPRVN